MPILNLLVEIQTNFNRLREMRRTVKSLLQNRDIAFRYEDYLRKNTSIRSARTIQDYVNPKHSSTVFNTFKYFEQFLQKDLEYINSLEPEKTQTFLSLLEKLQEVRRATLEVFKIKEVASGYERFLLEMGMSAAVSKRWASPLVEWTEWFDSMEHLPNFLAKNDRYLRSLDKKET